MKLQLWDTAGTERFRSVSRSYYRGAAGAILVYDLTSKSSFNALPTFLNDARALASPDLTVVLAGNKIDLASGTSANNPTTERSPPTPASTFGKQSSYGKGVCGEFRDCDSSRSSIDPKLNSRLTATAAPEGREVTPEESAHWASRAAIPVSVEVSALSGEGVQELFARLAGMILTKIELGEIDPGDPMSGIQYGDNGTWQDGGSIRSAALPKRRRPDDDTTGAWESGMIEWEAVFKTDGISRRRRRGCC